MKPKNEIERPEVFFIDTDRLTTAKAEMNIYCTLANSILEDLSQLEVNTPEDIEQAKELIYSGTDKIRETIIQNQKAKMSNLPTKAIDMLISLPVDMLNKLSLKMYSFQTRHTATKINQVDFVIFENGLFAVNSDKLERSMTIYRTEAITNALRLSNELIESFNRLKDFCESACYPGKVVEYDSFLNFNENEQKFELNPLGFQYFPLSK